MSTTPDYEELFSERNENQTEKEPYQYQIRMMYLVTYGIVLVLGLSLNFILVFVGWQRYKSYKKIAIWVLALAATHLIFCGALVFQLLYAYYDFEWYYGTVTCKLSSYITYGSMYSTATILSLWSFNSAFSKSACIKRSKNCNIFLILFSWTLAAVLAMPSLFSREIQLVRCVDDYDFYFKTSPGAIKKLKAVVVSRLLFGLVIPAFVMFVSCCVATKSFHNTCVPCKKQTQIICAVKVVYFVCWGPQIFLTLLQATTNNLYPNAFKYGLPTATALATTHCFTCPLIYILGECSVKMHWMTHDPDGIENTADHRLHLLNKSSA
ncbi:chemerin-like receptor 1 [Triplophysa dalaica]|uniref:chemerin-like receptor 1 n=1 Tax=Triplophysa dalaica TaxID=1582913 RepID=UPI0024DF3B79|nr:chemerin-like receptor 1 [Triplophysa dalaica]XP_056602411.1 chemerin-like receptor 1 [Triplophysa dalaica]